MFNCSLAALSESGSGSDLWDIVNCNLRFVIHNLYNLQLQCVLICSVLQRKQLRMEMEEGKLSQASDE